MNPLLYLSTVLLFTFNFSGTLKPAKETATTSLSKEEVYTIKERKEDAEYIPWIPDRRLSWDDFLCAPKTNTDAVASTSTALGISYQVKNSRLVYQVSCNFSKIKSWGLLKNPYILAHEQGHFDITEIFARKLNQMLQGYQFNRYTYQKDINNIYEGVVKEKETYQLAYDDQTDHSRNKKKQKEWVQRIDALLYQTQPYANYP